MLLCIFPKFQKFRILQFCEGWQFLTQQDPKKKKRKKVQGREKKKSIHDIEMYNAYLQAKLHETYKGNHGAVKG